MSLLSPNAAPKQHDGMSPEEQLPKQLPQQILQKLPQRLLQRLAQPPQEKVMGLKPGQPEISSRAQPTAAGNHSLSFLTDFLVQTFSLMHDVTDTVLAAVQI